MEAAETLKQYGSEVGGHIRANATIARSAEADMCPPPGWEPCAIRLPDS